MAGACRTGGRRKVCRGNQPGMMLFVLVLRSYLIYPVFCQPSLAKSALTLSGRLAEITNPLCCPLPPPRLRGERPQGKKRRPGR